MVFVDSFPWYFWPSLPFGNFIYSNLVYDMRIKQECGLSIVFLKTERKLVLTEGDGSWRYNNAGAVDQLWFSALPCLYKLNLSQVYFINAIHEVKWQVFSSVLWYPLLLLTVHVQKVLLETVDEILLFGLVRQKINWVQFLILAG